MSGDSAATQIRGWRRAFWLVFALLLGGLAGIELVAYAAQEAAVQKLERSAGRVEPSEIEALRRRNDELGRDPKRSAEKFREDLLVASLISLPWPEYFDRSPLRWLRRLLAVSVFLSVFVALCAFLLGMGRGGARWALFLASLGQILCLGAMALLAVHVSQSYADDLLRDLRIRQDDVATAIGTQAPIAKISIPGDRKIRAVGALLFLAFSAPWQLTLLLSSRPRLRAPNKPPVEDRGEQDSAEFVEALEEEQGSEARDSDAGPRSENTADSKTDSRRGDANS